MLGIKLGGGRNIERLFNNRGLFIGLIITGAFFAFQAFNYFTTYTALHDMFGPMAIWGIKLATTLTIALCFMDLAGLARIFTPQTGADEPVEVWYLFGAWILACLADAVLTWWAISVAMITNPTGSIMFAAKPITAEFAPILISGIELFVRLGLVTFIAKAGDRIFSYNTRGRRPGVQQTSSRSVTYTPPATPSYPRPTTSLPGQRPAAKPTQTPVRSHVDPRDILYPSSIDPRNLP